MRESFPEFYGPDDQQLKALLTDGLLVLDTNVLFELYRVTTADREAIQQLLDGYFEGRVWIPWRVGFEYHRKRLDIVRAQAGNYGRPLDFGRAEETALMKQLDGLQLPEAVSDRLQRLIPGLVEAIEKARAEYVSTVRELTSQHLITPETATHDDPVQNWLNSLIGTNVGERWDENRLAKEQKTGEERISKQIPPAFKDAGKASAADQVGDYLIWREILDKAAEPVKTGPGVLFVSNDVKEDWVEKSGGRVIGPRPELRAEFQIAWPGGTYHQVRLSGLLDLAKTHLQAEISQEAVRRVNDLEAAANDTPLPAHLTTWARIAESDPDAVYDVAQRIAANYPDSPEAQAAANELLALTFGLPIDQDTEAIFRDRDLIARYLSESWLPQLRNRNEIRHAALIRRLARDARRAAEEQRDPED